MLYLLVDMCLLFWLFYLVGCLFLLFLRCFADFAALALDLLGCGFVIYLKGTLVLYLIFVVVLLL